VVEEMVEGHKGYLLLVLLILVAAVVVNSFIQTALLAVLVVQV
jgi:hypothetical protein